VAVGGRYSLETPDLVWCQASVGSPSASSIGLGRGDGCRQGGSHLSQCRIQGLFGAGVGAGVALGVGRSSFTEKLAERQPKIVGSIGQEAEWILRTWSDQELLVNDLVMGSGLEIFCCQAS